MSNDGQFKNAKSIDNPSFRGVIADTTAFMKQNIFPGVCANYLLDYARANLCAYPNYASLSLSDHLFEAYVGINVITS
ncbi:MAG: hypothetical protein K0Q78_1319 [Cellvibrio sp.]|jgi:hypothetical protein|nr:hypothetical protein [Cellvibrio sp.]